MRTCCAIEAGAEAHQQFAVESSQLLLGLDVHFDPAAIGQGQGLIGLQGDLGEAAHPAGRDRRQEGKLGVRKGVKVIERDIALVQDHGETSGACWGRKWRSISARLVPRATTSGTWPS